MIEARSLRRRTASTLLVLLLALSGSTVGAQAQDPKTSMDGSGPHRLALFVRSRYEPLRPFAARSEALMRQYLASCGRFELKPLHRVIDSGALPEASGALKEGEALLQQGLAAFRRDSATEAEEALNKAAMALEKGGALLDDTAPLIQVDQLLGQLQLKQGNTREANVWFGRAVAQAPDNPLDPSVFPEETVQLYERVRKEPPAGGSELAVESQPTGATVLLDGRFVGITPVSLQPKLTGRHLVRVVLDGYLPAAAPVELEQGKKAKVQKTLAPLRHAENFRDTLERAMQSLGEEELTADSPIHELGELLEVEELVLVRVLATRDRQAIVEGFHYDFLDGQLVHVGDRLLSISSSSLDQDAVQFVDDLLGARLELTLSSSLALAPLPAGASFVGGKLAPTPADQPGGGAGGGSRRKLWASPWLWAGVGGAALVAAGTTTVILVSSSGKEEPAKPKDGRLLFGFE